MLRQELSQLAAGIDHYAVAVPLTPQNVAEQSKLLLGDPTSWAFNKIAMQPPDACIPRFEKWRTVLRFERTNPLQLGAEEWTVRVALVYQQALMTSNDKGSPERLRLAKTFCGRWG